MKVKFVLAALSICVLGSLTTLKASASARYSEPRKVRLWCGGASASFIVTGNISICKDRRTGDTYRVSNLGIGLIFGVSAGIDYIDISTSCRSIEGDLVGGGAQYVHGVGIKGEIYKNRCARALIVGARVGAETGIAIKGMTITKLYRDREYDDREVRNYRFASTSDEERPRRSNSRFQEQQAYAGWDQRALGQP